MTEHVTITSGPAPQYEAIIEQMTPDNLDLRHGPQLHAFRADDDYHHSEHLGFFEHHDEDRNHDAKVDTWMLIVAIMEQSIDATVQYLIVEDDTRNDTHVRL